ncbi:MAG TPA: hypothetical protein VLT32_02875 [Candidatus Sulfomarinibacteraceae bacterium]|nr:hypothetical protein [Candidatus Sulfomarinibacteraceae bacterium]
MDAGRGVRAADGARRVVCDLILTEDLQDGRDLDGVRVESPF